MTNDTPSLDIQVLEAHIRRVFASRGYLNVAVKVDILPQMVEAMVYREIRVLEETELPTTITVEVPLDWWQHVKQRWFPGWVLAHWPVKTRDIETFRQFVRWCPHIAIPSIDKHRDFLFPVARPLDWKGE